MKTPRAIGLALALMAAFMVPASAISQGKKAPPAVSEAARKAGMAQAPAVVTAVGVPCQVADARLIGEDKKTKTSYFEVACGAGAMGYVLQNPAGGTPTAFSCIEANTPPAPASRRRRPACCPATTIPRPCCSR